LIGQSVTPLTVPRAVHNARTDPKGPAYLQNVIAKNPSSEFGCRPV
jgi:hypothetical protein